MIVQRTMGATPQKVPLTEEAVDGELLNGGVRDSVVRHEGEHAGVCGLKLHPLRLAHGKVFVTLAVEPRRVAFLRQREIDDVETK